MVSDRQDAEATVRKMKELGYDHSWQIENSPQAVGLTKRQFYRNYRECGSCLETLDKCYDTAVIIDEHQAFCEICARIAADDNIKILAGG